MGGYDAFNRDLKRPEDEQAFRVTQEHDWGHIKSKLHVRNSNGIIYYVVLFRNLRLKGEVRAEYLNLKVISI